MYVEKNIKVRKSMKEKFPENIRKYFDSLFENFNEQRLIIVFDPNGLLRLGVKYIDPDGKNWKAYHYYGNDFSFRKEYSQKPSDPNFSHIIWITKPNNQYHDKIDISYIPDIIERAEEIIDVRIDNILKRLIPNETFPQEILLSYEKDISENLGNFISKTKELRIILGYDKPFTKSDILKILLTINNENIYINELIFENNEPIELLGSYTYLIFANDFDTYDTKILKSLITENIWGDDKNILSYLEIEREELAVFLYVFEIFINNEVRNPIIQMKGLGILGFEPRDWISYTNGIKTKLYRQGEVWEKIVCLAEENLPESTIYKIIGCFPIESKEQIISAILNNSSPLLIYGLLTSLIKNIVKSKYWKGKGEFIIDNIKMHPLFQEDVPQSKYINEARGLLNFFVEIAFIIETLKNNLNLNKDLTSIIEWYDKNKIYRLELSLAIAVRSIKVINDVELRNALNIYFEKYIKVKIEHYLHNLDLYLANFIDNNLNEYFMHPRLAINIIKDCIINKGIKPSDNCRIWILIFDGMRLDSWNEVIKPVILEKFEITNEDFYFCVIPSITDIARISLLAGKIPSEWEDYNYQFTSNHNILASKLFNLNLYEGKEKLRIIVASETDFGQRKLDFEIKPYNILIYNLSDDWIHSFKGDIKQLNDRIQDSLIKDILPDLEGRIEKEDTILISSDHGFIELNRNNEKKIVSNNPSQITYRYLKNIQHTEGVKIQYNSKVFYTVAKGRDWFGRERGRFNRYSHGGISFDEMIVPAVTLKKSSVVILEFEISKFEKEIEVLEDKRVTVDVLIKNIGNKEGIFEFLFELDSGEKKTFTHRLPTLAEKILKFDFQPILRNKRLELTLKYKNAKNKPITKKATIYIKVIGRKDKVEFEFGALDKIDEVLKEKE